MKKIISTLLLFGAMLFTAQAQIVITEISYNTPSVDIEFIELYNNSATNVDLSGWSFSQGITYTFPAGISIAPAAYLLVAADSMRMQDYFGVVSYPWDPSGNNGLSNSGEDIVIVDDMGMTIDSVDFEDNSGGWPRICDGQGPSLILCDVTSDNNLVTNWGFSPTSSGTRHGTDSSMLFCSPGTANGVCPTSPAILFDGTYDEVSEGDGIIEVGFIMAHTGPMDSATVELSVTVASTATAGTDYTFTTTVGGAGSVGVGGWSFVDIPVSIIDDAIVEGDETIVFTISNPTMGAVILNTGDYVVKIIDNDTQLPPLPRYNIGLLTADANGDGDADSLGIRCEVQGIVHGIDLQGGGSVQFTIIDATGGMGVFSGDPFGYTVTEGDEVLIPGLVGAFNGLAQMTPDTITVVSTGNMPVTPTVVTTLDETTESEIVTFECVTLLDTSRWPTSGGSTNLDFTNGVDTFAIRIDSDTDLNGTPPPSSKWLNITGIGGQFDSSTPRNDGYQLFPRYMADVVELGNPAVSFVTANDTIGEAGATVTVAIDITNGNPDTTAVTVSLAAANSTATEGSDFTFSDVTLNFNGCGADNASFDVTITDDNDLEGDETIVLVVSLVTNNAEVSIDTVTIVITDDEVISIDNKLNADAISLYPNPATDKLVIDASLPIERLQVLTLVGQEVMSIDQPTQKTTLSVSHLPKGTYLVRAQTAEGVWMAKWMKF